MISKAGYSTLDPNLYLERMQGIIEATQDLTGLGRIY